MKRILSLLLFVLCIGAQAQTFQGYTKVVADANALQALNPYDIHQVVRMRGYASAAAADGAIFYFDTTSAAATNTVSVFKPTSVSGNGRWIRQDPTFQAGSTTVPSITFGLDSNTGFANSAADQIDIINGGLRKWYITSGGIFTAVGAQTIGTTTGDLTLNTGAANGNILFNPNGTGGVGIGTTPSGGANSLKIGGTTASTTTATGSLINAGGFGNAGAANIGGVTAVTDTTEATTGGAGALKSSGGIYSAKKIVGATDLIVNTSLLYADSAVSRLGIGTTGPDKKLDVLDTTGLQYRATYTDGTVYSDWGTLSSGATLSTNSLGHRTTSTVVNDSAVQARAVQGGLAFDGVTAGAKAVHTIASVTTSDITASVTFLAGTSQTTFACPLILGSSATSGVAATTLCLRTDANSLALVLFGATTTDYNTWTWTGFNATYGTKLVTVTVVRSSTAATNPVIYVNGIDVTASGTFSTSPGGTTPPTWQGSIVSTYAIIGGGTAAVSFNGPILDTRLFNRALTAAEVATLANQGVQESDKWGSLTASYTSDFTAGASPNPQNNWTALAGTVTGDIDGIGSPSTDDTLRYWADGTSANHGPRITTITLTANKRYRVAWSYFIPSGNTTLKRVGIYGQAGASFSGLVVQTVTGTWTDVVSEGYLAASQGIAFLGLTSASSGVWTGANSVTDDLLYIKNVVVTPIGSILDADLAIGTGYTIPDKSSNGYNGTMSTTGVSHSVAQPTLRYDRDYSSTVNARQLQGGLAFDGTTSGATSATTTSIGTIGLSSFSIAATFNLVNAVSATVAIASVTAGSGTSLAAGDVQIRFIASTLDFIMQDVGYQRYAIDMTPYFGKVVHFVAVRDASSVTPTFYINGVATAFTPALQTQPANTINITATQFKHCYQNSSTGSVLLLYGSQLFNRALSASEVVTLANQGVQEADKWGSLTAKYTSDFSAGVDGWVGQGLSSFDGNIDGIGVPPQDNNLRLTSDATTGNHRAYVVPTTTVGKRYRVKFDYYMPVAANTSAKQLFYTAFGNSTLIASPADSTWTTVNVAEFTHTGAGASLIVYMANNSGTPNYTGTSGDLLYLRNITITQIGSILDADLSAGIGYQVPDRSSNKYHGTVSTTGTAWTLANRRGQVRATTNTSGNQQILGQSCLPTTAIIKSIVGYTAGTPTIYIGNVSAGNQHVTATAMSASTYTDFTVATKSTTGNVWVNSTTADTINWVIDYILGDY